MEPPPLVTRALELAAARRIREARVERGGRCPRCTCSPRGEESRGPPRSEPAPASARPGSSRLSRPPTPFFTAETDPDRAAAVATFFADDPNVTVLAGSWRETLPPEAPFDLLFVDASDAKDDVDATIGLLAPGGTAVLDDFPSRVRRLPMLDAMRGSSTRS